MSLQAPPSPKFLDFVVPMQRSCRGRPRACPPTTFVKESATNSLPLRWPNCHSPWWRAARKIEAWILKCLVRQLPCDLLLWPNWSQQSCLPTIFCEDPPPFHLSPTSPKLLLLCLQPTPRKDLQARSLQLIVLENFDDLCSTRSVLQHKNTPDPPPRLCMFGQVSNQWR